MRKERFLIWFGGAFGLFGMLFLGWALTWVVINVNFLGSAERTHGTVIDLVTKHGLSIKSHSSSRLTLFPVVEFVTADGQRSTFESSTGGDPPAHELGERVPVAYDPDNPSAARITSFGSLYLGSLIFGIFGLLFMLAGGFAVLVARRTQRRRSWLRQHGQEAWGEVTDVGYDRSFEVNDRHPFILHATWEDPRTGQFHTAKSESSWDDLRPRFPAGSRVRVLFNPDDPTHNLVDLAADPTRS